MYRVIIKGKAFEDVRLLSQSDNSYNLEIEGITFKVLKTDISEMIKYEGVH